MFNWFSPTQKPAEGPATVPPAKGAGSPNKKPWGSPQQKANGSPTQKPQQKTGGPGSPQKNAAAAPAKGNGKGNGKAVQTNGSNGTANGNMNRPASTQSTTSTKASSTPGKGGSPATKPAAAPQQQQAKKSNGSAAGSNRGSGGGKRENKSLNAKHEKEMAMMVQEETVVLKDLPTKAWDTLSPQMKAFLDKNGIDLNKDKDFKDKYERMLNADTVVENTIRASAYIHGEHPERKVEMLRKSMGRNLIDDWVFDDEFNAGWVMEYEKGVGNYTWKTYNAVLMENIAQRALVNKEVAEIVDQIGENALKNCNLVDKEKDGKNERKTRNPMDYVDKDAWTGIRTTDTHILDKALPPHQKFMVKDERTIYKEKEGTDAWGRTERKEKVYGSTVNSPVKKGGQGGKFTVNGGVRLSRDVEEAYEPQGASKSEELSNMKVVRSSQPMSPKSQEEYYNQRWRQEDAEESWWYTNSASQYDVDYDDEIQYNMAMHNPRSSGSLGRSKSEQQKDMSKSVINSTSEFPPLSPNTNNKSAPPSPSKAASEAAWRFNVLTDPVLAGM